MPGTLSYEHELENRSKSLLLLHFTLVLQVSDLLEGENQVYQFASALRVECDPGQLLI